MAALSRHVNTVIAVYKLIVTIAVVRGERRQSLGGWNTLNDERQTTLTVAAKKPA